MVELKILNPQATTAITPVSFASRLSDLSGRTIGLFWNMKAGGDVALEQTARLLADRFPKSEFRYYAGSVGAIMRHATPEDIERMARECDAVVGTTGD